MQVGILEVGRPPEELGGRFASYPEMAAEWLGCAPGTATVYPLIDGVPPPATEDNDLWVITGSRHGVYEDHAFIPPLKDFIRAAFANGRRLVGICFGHQAIASALGGEVIRSPMGWGLGPHAYDVDPAGAPEGFPLQALHMHAFHQDQVTRPPEGAVLLASSDFCRNAAFWYPGRAISFQGHPEFRDDYMRALLETRRGRVLPEALADRTLARLGAPDNCAALAAFVRRTEAW
ncbi:type 1 glutamine amidotransferase [Shinella pollutisoli]|uniref:Type 1 glutamine amidotransferase n=1 Tax=Shinella pollutisoli TaxID=2250594 RepID=A0ABV7DEB5_9HYPH|nr:type 1 glutamine amidotransferase [Shinella pollutisoli]